MKKFIRTLSMLVCVAMLMTTVPVETLLDLRAVAEDEVVQAVQQPDENPTPAPEQAPVEQKEDEVPVEEPTQVPVVETTQVSTEVPVEEPTEVPVVESTEVPTGEPELDSNQAGEDELTAQQTSTAEPVVEETMAPEATEDPNVIDYAADAGKNPAFVLGYAEILQGGTAVYDAADASAEVKAEIGKGVVYVVARSADPDRLQIAFHVGVPVLDTGWVNAENLRPMDPAVELHPYFLSCEGVENLLFYNNSYDLPLKVIECAYTEVQETEAPAATEEPKTEATIEPTEEPETEVTTEPTEEAETEAVTEPAEEPKTEVTTEPTEEPETETVTESTEEAETEVTAEPEAEGTIEPTEVQDPETTEEPVLDVEAEVLPEDGEEVLMMSARPMMMMSMRSTPVLNPESVEFTQDTLRLGVGNTYDLLTSGLIQLTPEGATTTYTFKSENENILSVSDDGMLTAKQTGKVELRVTTACEKSDTITVEVCSLPTSVSLTPAAITLGVGMTSLFEVAFSEGTYDAYSFAYDDTVVSMDGNGMVTALKEGSTAVTLTTSNGLTASAQVNVVPAPEAITFSETSLVMRVGDAPVSLNGAYPEGTMCTFTYSSDDESVAKVDPITGEVTAIGPGRTSIYATAQNARTAPAVCTIEVISDPTSFVIEPTTLLIGCGDSFDLPKSGMFKLSEGSFATYTYSVDNANISVSPDGVIKGEKVGSATVAVTTHNGIKKTLKVTVSNAPTAVYMEPDAITLGEDMKAQLTVSFPSKSYSRYNYVISDPASVSVDANGVVTALKASAEPVTVTVKTDNGLSKTSIINVLPIPETISAVEDTVYASVKQAGRSVKGVYPDGTMCEFTYKSLDETVAVVDAQTGAITAKAVGDAVVTITSKNSKAVVANCLVKVVDGPASIKMGVGSLKMGVGNTYDLLSSGLIQNTPVDAPASYSFKTSDSRYVAVNSKGILTAKRAGTITITVTSNNNRKATMKVQVYNAAKSVTLSPATMELGVEMTGKLNVAFPSKTYSVYEFVDSNPGVVTIDSNGNIAAKAAGTTTIKVKALSGPEAESTITVHPMPAEIYPVQERVVLGVGEPGHAVQGVYPEGTMCEFTYKSLNEEVASVNPTTGAITAHKVGEAVVEITTANSKAVKTQCTVQVVPAPDSIELKSTRINLGEKDKFNLLETNYIENLPLNSSASYTFKSSNTKYVKVSANGEITGVKAGSATVTVTSHNKKSVKLTVKVYKKPKSATVAPLVLGEGMTGSLNITYPSGGYYSAYTLQDYDTNIITADAYGRITGVKAGETPVNVVVSSIANPIATTVKVLPMPTAEQISMNGKNMRIGVGEKGRSVGASYAEGTMCEFTYSSSDESKLKVHPLTGAMTAIAEGTVTVTATTRNSAGHKTSCEVTVVAAPSAINIEPSLIRLGLGNSYDLLNSGLIENIPETSSASYTFKTSNSKYVTVNSAGILTAKKNGTVTITVTSHNGKKDTVTVKVYSAPKWIELELDGERVSEKTLGVEMQDQLAVVFPSKTYNLHEVAITGDEGVLSLSADNVLTAVKPGKATITVTAPVNSKTTRTDKIDITVVPMPESITAAKERIVLGVSEPGKSVQGVYPEGTMCEFTYKSLNEEVASVNPTTGAITAHKVGEAVVEITTANSKAVKTQCTVQVVPAPDSIELKSTRINLGVKDKFNLLETNYIENLPLNSSASYTFKSSNTKYVKVSANGEITGVKAGSATVTVTSHNKKSVKLTVKVYKKPKSATVAPLVLGEGMTGSLNITYPSGGYYSAYTLQDYDTNIITADAYGRITGVKAGETPVNVVVSSIANPIATTVKVLPMPTAEQISMNGKSVRIGVGEKGRSVGASYAEGTMCEFTYSSSDESKLKVHPLTGAMTAIAEGTVTVTATTRNSAAHKTSCEVTVVAAPSAINIEPSLIRLGLGNSYDLLNSGVIENIPETSSASYTFKTSNSKYVTVNSAGILTAKKNGTVTITVTSHNGKKDTVTVKVYSAPKWIELELDGERVSEKTLGVEMQDQLAVVFPSKTYNLHEVAITGDEGVLSLSAENVLTAVKPGKATITVTAPVNNTTTRTDKIDITVVPMPESITAAKERIVLGVSEPGKSVQGVYPEGTMCEFRYKSLNEEVASVNPTTGAITAHKVGEAVVEITTANSKAVKTQCTVQVVPAPTKIVMGVGTLRLGKGNTFDLLNSGLIKNEPEGSSASYSFKTSNSKYVTVDKNGILTAKNNGTATITVTAHNGKKATITVKVYTLPKSVSISPEVLQLGVGMSGSFNVSYPSSTYALYDVASADEAIAKIDANGNVVAVKEGEASIVVTTSNKLTAVGKVNVVPAPSTVAFEKAEYTVAAEGMSLKAVPVINNGSMASYTFSSSDPSIATIDQNGVITGLKGGEATITVETQNKIRATAKVTVTPAPAELVYEELTNIVIAKGDTITLNDPRALDANGDVCPSTFTFKSSNTKVAKVNGNSVTGVAAGTVTITVSSYNGKTTSFKLTVSSQGITGVDLAVTEKTLYVNDEGYAESVYINASVIGNGLNEGSLRYQSSNTEIADVTADGLVTAKAPGTAYITVSAFNNKSAVATITVAKLSSKLAFAKTEEVMTEQKTLQLQPIFDEGTSAPVVYQSSDASIAVVDEYGLVTALKPGDVTINAVVDVEGEETRFDLAASVKIHIIAAPTNIFLNVTGVNLMVNESITLEPKLEANAEEFDKTIVFESTDPWVATVDSASGAVTAVGAGEAVIIAKTCNGLTASCAVYVVAEGEMPEVGLDWEDEVTIAAGDSANLEINLNKAAFERGFTITSADPTKLTVDMNKLTIQALAAGTVDLTMTINPVEGEEAVVSDKCSVTIIEGTEITFSATELELRTLTSTTFEDSSAELKIINPHKNLIGTYSLEIEDDSLVIYDADAGIVQALEFAGTTNIVLKTYNQEIKCAVTVINRPTYRALIIGEFNNSGASNDLPFTANNTNAMATVLNAAVIDGEKYAKVVKKANNPTKNQIQSAISETFGDAREGDVSVLYIVSHGYDVAANGGYHFGIYNYNKSNSATYVRHSDLMDWLAPIKGNVVLVLDSCKSGAFIRDARSRLEAEGNIAVITAQDANRNASFYQGTTSSTQVEFLTYTFCEGLGYVYSDKSTGKPKWLSSVPADSSPSDGTVTIKEILSYTDRNVPGLVAEYMKTFTNGKSKFRVPGVYSTTALKAWGGQDPQVFMPNSMENVVIFG